MATPTSSAIPLARFRLLRGSWTMPGLALIALMAFPAAAQITVELNAIAGGGGRSASAGGCLVLVGTLGQTVAGSASAGNFSLCAGYWCGLDSGSRDTLFNTGFEECL
jgi:hypothetical protein